MRGRRIFAGLACAIALGGGTIGLIKVSTGGGTSFTANLYLAPASGGNGAAACTKSGSLVDYSTAVTNGNVCHSLEKACLVAAGGIVGVKSGNYPDVPGGSTLPNGEDGFDDNCGPSGNSVNPNSVEQGGGAVTAMSGWAEFRCADGDTSVSQFAIPNLYMRTNAHAYLHGGCFRFHNIFIDYGGDSGLNAQNIVFRGVTNRIYFDAIESHGAKNIGVYYWEQGPYAICAGAATVPANGANDKCSSNTTTGEAQYQSRSGPDDGPAPAACTQSCGGNTDQQGGQFPWIGRNLSGSSINVRFENGISHDSQSRDNTPWHTGCGHIFQNNGTGANGVDDATANSNIVIDGYHCYRTDVFGIYVEGSEGVTIQNSSFGCPSGPVGQNGTLTGNWYSCTSTQPGIEVICQNGPATLTNVLIRYNSVATFATLRGDTCTSYSNVRVVGNVFEQGGNSCETGVTWNYNAYGDAGCGTDANKFSSISNPFAVDDRTTISYPPSAGQSAASNVGFDPSLTAGTKAFEHQLPTTGDFALLVDQSGASRPASGQTLNTAGSVSR